MKSCEQGLWDLAEWLQATLEESKLTGLSDPHAPEIEQLAVKVLKNAGKDQELLTLLTVFSNRPEHPSARGVYLSALRNALGYIAASNTEFAGQGYWSRLGLYRLNETRKLVFLAQKAPERQDAAV